jgi:hypothetical protein
MSNEGHWTGDETDGRWGLEDSDDGYGLGCEAALPGLQWLAPPRDSTVATALVEPTP